MKRIGLVAVLVLWASVAVAAPWRFIVSGDSRSDRAARRAVAEGVMSVTGGDFAWWINTGDVTDNAEVRQYDNWIADMVPVGLDYNWSSDHVRWFNADIGNHERGNLSRFISYFPGHTNKSAYSWITGHPQGAYGSFKYRGVLIVWLARYATPSSQAQFMADTAAAAGADPDVKFRFVHWHFPPAGCSGHGSDGTSDGWADQYFYPAGFQAGFYGHNHIYTRTCPMTNTSSKTCGDGGMTHLTVGTAGAPLKSCGCPNWISACQAQHGFLVMTIDGDSVTGQFYSVDRGEGSPANPKLEDTFTFGPPVPHCGDGQVNVPGEECDGADDVICPGLCKPDCVCGEPGTPDLRNGGFEEGNGTTAWLGWGSAGNAGEAVISTDAHTGVNSVQMFDSSQKTRMVYQELAVTPGESYDLSFWAKVKNMGTDQARVRVVWSTGVDEVVLSAGTVGWTSQYRTVTAPAGITARLELVHLPVTDGVPFNDAEVWYDDIRFVVTGTPTTTTVPPPTTTTTAPVPTTSTVMGPTTTTVHTTTTTTPPTDCEETLAAIRALVCQGTTTTMGATTTTGVGSTVTTTTTGEVTTTEGVTTTTRPPVLEIILDGEQGMYNDTVLPTGTRIDARTATFTDKTASLSGDKEGAITLKGGSHLSVLGGQVTGDYPRTQGWSYFHDGARNHAGVLVLTPNARIEGTTIDNVEEGLRCQDGGATDFTLFGVHMTDIHDDAIDSHWNCVGLVEDTLIEGSYVVVSTRAMGRPRFPHRVMTLRNNLIWQKPFPDPHSSESRNPGHGATFKLDSDGRGPKFVLEGNVFLWQQNSNGGIAIPKDGRMTIERCSGNTAVWIGGGSFPGDLGRDPQTGNPCFTVTTDRSVWDQAVAAWKAAH